MENQQLCFERLIENDLDVLRSAAYRILRNAADVDEAIQNAMLSAWQKFEIFRSEAKLSSWVYRITVNSAYDMLRQRQKEQQKLKEYAVVQESMETGDPEDRFEELNQAIASLPEKYREAISVGFLSGFPAEKAADILGCSVNTLQQQIHRAKEMLKEKMKGQVTR